MDLPDFSELALLINSISHFLDEYGAGFFNEARLSFFQEMARELSEKASRDCEALYVRINRWVRSGKIHLDQRNCR